MENEAVLGKFMSGIDCSQLVFAHAAEKLGMDREEALKLAACFGGGMMLGETCGCMTGALMAIGMKYGHSEQGNTMEQKGIMAAKKQAFEEAWKKIKPSFICKDLVEHDISKPGELEKIMQEGKFQSVCAPMVIAACNILDEIMQD